MFELDRRVRFAARLMPHVGRRARCGASRRSPLGAILWAAVLLGSGAPLAAASGPRPPSLALDVPADSLVRVLSYDRQSLTAKFAPARFVLTGAFRYGCIDECSQPFRQQDMQLEVFPDPQVAARLPRWKDYTPRMAIMIDDSGAFAAKAIPPQVMQDLQHGRRKWVTGRVTMVADRFHAGIDCDSAWYSARFVSLVDQPSLTAVQAKGGSGCD